MEHGDAESANLMSVSLLRLTNGRCLLFACRKFASADGTMNCIPSAAYSDDNAQSWSALRPLVKSEGYFILCNDRVVPLKSGKLIAPIATQDNRLQFWTSSNQGETWRCEPMTLSSDENNFSCRVYQEPGVVELANGTLWCWCRTDAQMQYGTFSQDEGKTWSEVRPMPDFRSPMAPMSVKRNPRNGHLVAVWDDHMPRWDVPPPIYTRPGWGDVSTGGRHPLVLAESSDEGCSWIQARRLESDTRRGFCYTAMHFTREALLLAYCCGGLNDTIMLQDMKLVRIPMRADGTLKLEGI
ncbi:hypothetical protein SDC9_105142 [bioreactor metagenome]|uniref:Sialidase domain-containing protein n=1 Tax=bioreactor metagenome TaxID=1076179 RepID=A0A645B175_9ZZZZ